MRIWWQKLLLSWRDGGLYLRYFRFYTALCWSLNLMFHLSGCLSAIELHEPSLWGPLQCLLAKVEEPCGMFQRSVIGFRCYGPLANPSPTFNPLSNRQSPKLFNLLRFVSFKTLPETLKCLLTKRIAVFSTNRAANQAKLNMASNVPLLSTAEVCFLPAPIAPIAPPGLSINILRKNREMVLGNSPHINGNHTGTPWMKALLVIKV